MFATLSSLLFPEYPKCSCLRVLAFAIPFCVPICIYGSLTHFLQVFNRLLSFQEDLPSQTGRAHMPPPVPSPFHFIFHP